MRDQVHPTRDGPAVTVVLATLVGLALAVVVLVVVRTTGQNRLTRDLATGVGVVCLVLFVLINVSDWPGGFLQQFWLDHAIIGATAGSLLLAATVFLVYRYRDLAQQELVDESIVDAGRAELVERLVDIDVALSLLCRDSRPELCHGEQWQKNVRGLEWLRDHLGELGGADDDYWAEVDPRLWSRASHRHPDDWRLPLLDQMIRRVTGGVRAWGPVFMRSHEGQQDLVAFANLRLVLVELDRRLRVGEGMDVVVARELQHWVHRLALLLEVDERNPVPRAKLFVPPLDVGQPGPSERSTDLAVRRVLDRIELHVERRVRRSTSSRTSRTSARRAGAGPSRTDRVSST